MSLRCKAACSRAFERKEPKCLKCPAFPVFSMAVSTSHPHAMCLGDKTASFHEWVPKPVLCGINSNRCQRHRTHSGARVLHLWVLLFMLGKFSNKLRPEKIEQWSESAPLQAQCRGDCSDIELTPYLILSRKQQEGESEDASAARHVQFTTNLGCNGLF